MPNRRILAGICGLLCSSIAYSADAVQGNQSPQSFPADYFAASRPADAYDMVRKLPGFEIVEGDEDVRGFSGSRGNVLFDGRTPSGKEESLEDALRRIPASSVLRIELLRGGATSSATGGYDLVANVIRRSVASASYSLLGGVSAAEGAGVKPDGRFELTRQSGERRLETAVSLETDIDDDSGHGRLIEGQVGGGELSDEHRDEREFSRTLAARTEYQSPIGTGQLVGNLNLSREKAGERIEAQQQDERSIATEHQRTWAFEGGAQYRADLHSGKLETLAVQRLGRLNSVAEEKRERFRESRRTSESIARGEYRGGGGKVRWFGSLEAAFNRLTSDAKLTENDVQVPISGSDVHVSERRAEASIGAVWNPGPDLTIEPTMRVEHSAIRSRGDSKQDDRFLFWKPRLRGTWERAKTRAQVTIEREAAQLDFGDFVASAELGREDVLAGATSLVPPTTWSASATIERRFLDDGAILLTYRREWIDNVIDHVVVVEHDDLFDAVGNIGNGTRRTFRAEITLPLDRAGIEGFQVRSTLTFLKSRVTDPVTGERRMISEDRPFEGELTVIHDLPGGRWSWGADASFAHREKEFSFDEVGEERKGTAFGGYLEYRASAQWRARIDVENIGSRRLIDERVKYGGLRSINQPEVLESKRLRTSPIFSISIRRSFGTRSN